MSSKCSKCSQQTPNLQPLTCGHQICLSCLPESPFSQQFILPCPSCSIMSILESSLPPVQANPENYIVCLECKSDVMSTRVFLDSGHRKHDVVSVANVIHDVLKSLRKYQLAFDLESQALYTQIQCLSKDKREISEEYSRNCSSIQSSFQQLKNSISRSQATCLLEYEKQVLHIVESYDHKIKQIKSQIFKCESYMQCIDHSLVKCNASKHVAATQFYFKNLDRLTGSLNQLVETRRLSLGQIRENYKIKTPNFKPIEELNARVKGLGERIWAAPQQKPSPELQKNPQTQAQSFFQQKRKQIFNTSSTNENKLTSNHQPQQNQSKISLFSKQEKSTKSEIPSSPKSQFNESYNIDGRIQNLRKTLKLGEKKISSPHGYGNGNTSGSGGATNKSFAHFYKMF